VDQVFWGIVTVVAGFLLLRFEKSLDLERQDRTREQNFVARMPLRTAGFTAILGGLYVAVDALARL
jgi:hypothetical protein